MSEYIRAFNRLKAAAILTLLLLAYQQIAQTQNSRSEVIVFYPTQALTEIYGNFVTFQDRASH